MPSRAHNIVSGQFVNPAKLELAKLFRRRMTPAERLLWRALRNNSLRGLHFCRQQVVVGFIVDFYCHSASLAVEVDGPAHAWRADYDTERDRVLFGLGIRVMRVGNEALLQDVATATVVAEIERGATARLT